MGIKSIFLHQIRTGPRERFAFSITKNAMSEAQISVYRPIAAPWFATPLLCTPFGRSLWRFGINLDYDQGFQTVYIRSETRIYPVRVILCEFHITA